MIVACNVAVGWSSVGVGLGSTGAGDAVGLAVGGIGVDVKVG